MTFLGEFGSFAVLSLAESRPTNSGFAVPPPDPAKSGQQGVPASSLVPPKPWGLIGLTRTSEATASGWSVAYRIATGPPADQPTRWRGRPSMPSVSTSARRSSEKSATPLVASSGLVSEPPKPRRSGASPWWPGSAASVSSKKRPLEALPWTKRTGSPPPGPASRRWVRSLAVSTILEDTPSSRRSWAMAPPSGAWVIGRIQPDDTLPAYRPGCHAERAPVPPPVLAGFAGYRAGCV